MKAATRDSSDTVHVGERNIIKIRCIFRNVDAQLNQQVFTQFEHFFFYLNKYIFRVYFFDNCDNRIRAWLVVFFTGDPS